MSETTDFSLLEIKPEHAPVLYAENGLDQFYRQIESQVLGEVPDLNTAKGRARIASLAAQVSRSKTAVEKPGRDYLKKLKEQPKIIEAELRKWNTKCDALRDKVREPLNQWEAEQERIKALEKFNADHAEALELNADFDKALADRIESDHEIALLLNEKFDRDKEEAKRLAEQQRIEFEKRIVREAEDRAKRDAEEKAQREREESARREAALIAQAEQERIDRIAAQERAEREKQEAIEAERRKAKQAEQARLAEEQRIKFEADRRQADENHRKRIGAETVTALINVVGLTREQAISTFTAIKDGAVPHTKINY